MKLSDQLLPITNELRIFNTICNATYVRQQSSLELAKDCKLMIVIGGKNSSNTLMMAKLCSDFTLTKHIEVADEIIKEWFDDVDGCIGLTAGASTPDWIIIDIYNKIKSKMYLRNSIHKNKSIDDVLRSGCYRASLLVIQLIVIIIDDKGQYNVLFEKRSDKVADRAGFYQFIPKGAFEILGSEGDCPDFKLNKNFSLKYVIFREYLEELFNDKSYEKGTAADNLHRLKNDQRLIEIESMIKNGEACLEFLGSIVDLASLKNELSFALIIDKKDYFRKIFKTSEETEEFSRVPFHQFEDFVEEKINNKIIKKQLSPPSAALYKLFVDNHLNNDKINNILKQKARFAKYTRQ